MHLARIALTGVNCFSMITSFKTFQGSAFGTIIGYAFGTYFHDFSEQISYGFGTPSIVTIQGGITLYGFLSIPSCSLLP